MKRILITAYDVNPFKGSESATGWNFIVQAARFHQVAAITRKNNRPHIENYMASRPQDKYKNIQFYYFDLPKWACFWKRGARGSSLYFFLWQFFIVFFIQSKKIKYNILHNLNFHTDSVPTFLWLLGMPLVWGPINHHEAIPGQYLQNGATFRNKLSFFLKKANWVFSPLLYISKKKSSIILAGSSSVVRRLALPADKTHIFNQLGAVRAPFAEVKLNHSEFRVLFVGRLVSLKSCDLAIKAFSGFINTLGSSPQAKVKLTIVGKGPQAAYINRLIVDSNTDIERIEFIDFSKMSNLYAQSDVFLFPSHEGAGMVVVEALSHGLPVICFDNAGPGEIVSDNCAIRIPYSDYKTTLNNFSQALRALYDDPELHSKMSASAISLFDEKYDWDVKGATLEKIYAKADEK